MSQPDLDRPLSNEGKAFAADYPDVDPVRIRRVEIAVGAQTAIDCVKAVQSVLDELTFEVEMFRKFALEG